MSAPAKPELRKFTQTITLTVEFWGTGETLEEAPESWEWFRAGSPYGDMGGDIYDAKVEAAGPIELVDRVDYLLSYRGTDGRPDGWHVYGTDANDAERWQPKFVGSHKDALAWVAAQGGAVRR